MSRSLSRVFRAASNATWLVSNAINGVFPEGNLPSPSWAPGRLLKRQERMQMATGIPRKTLSLCPDCNHEAVEAVVKGEIDAADFRDNPGVVEAEILEEGGRILMRKACEKHGPFEDTLSNHPDFFRKMERLAFGRDFECVDDCSVHGHGPNTIRSGRGTFLIVDITNRCNMMCSPCFMDANAASYVHELNIEDIKTIFSNALSFKPQREINILFSGGEPTLCREQRVCSSGEGGWPARRIPSIGWSVRRKKQTSRTRKLHGSEATSPREHRCGWNANNASSHRNQWRQ
jgi:hypothetical protein